MPPDFPPPGKVGKIDLEKNTKNHIHVKKVGKTSELPFRIYWWTLKSPKNQTFDKMKKVAGDIILHMCIKNHNYMRYSSWDTEWYSFLSFWVIFTLSLSLPHNPEKQNFEKMKNASGDAIILNLSNKKHALTKK